MVDAALGARVLVWRRWEASLGAVRGGLCMAGEDLSPVLGEAIKRIFPL